MKTPLRSVTVVLLLLASVVRAEVPAAHQQADCSTCHRLDRAATASTAAARAVACVACHGADSVRPVGASVFHADAASRCTDCHSFHAPDAVRLPALGEGETVSLASLPRGTSGTADLTQCKPCHQTGGPSPVGLHPGHRAAAAWYHANVATVASQSVSESCLRCHDRDQDLPAELGPDWNPPRPARSANHPFGIAPRANLAGGYGVRTDIDPRLHLVGGRIECTTCHDLYNTTDDMLVAFETPEEMCVGCHVRTTSPSGGSGSLAMGR